MYIIVEVDGHIRSTINKKGQPDKYSEPKTFMTYKAAATWIEKHSYTGMSWRYEIIKEA